MGRRHHDGGDLAGGSHQLQVLPGAATPGEDDATRRNPRGHRPASGELGIVRVRGAPAHADGVEARPQPVHIFPGLVTRDPLRTSFGVRDEAVERGGDLDRKSTRLNSSYGYISYA